MVTADLAAHLDHPAAGRLRLGDGVTVHRLGVDTAQLTGPGGWGPPADPDAAVALLRRAAQQGVELFDTADSYGPEVAEDLVRRALHPYDGVVVATKVGLVRTGPDEWHPCGRPEYLRRQCELSLRRLGVERIELFGLHQVDPQVPADDQFGTLAALRDEGKVGAIGLCDVGIERIEQAQRVVDVATVACRYSLADRAADDVLRFCTEQGIGFLARHPTVTGSLGPVAEIAGRLGVSTPQLALAWLLQRSSVMVPIPGASSVGHLEDHLRAARLRLDGEDVGELDAAVRPGPSVSPRGGAG